MPAPHVPRDVASQLASVVREVITRTKAINPAASQEVQADALGITRVTLANTANGQSDRHKRTVANPQLGTLLALSRAGVRTVIDSSQPGGVAFEIDDEVLRRHALSLRAGS